MCSNPGELRSLEEMSHQDFELSLGGWLGVCQVKKWEKHFRKGPGASWAGREV